MSHSLIYPDWPAPSTIKTASTTRLGGFSSSPFDGFNLALHVGDAVSKVNKNRHLLNKTIPLPESPRWLNQIHGTHVCSASDWQEGDEADAIVSNTINQVCAIMTADCLPILLCNQQGDWIAAIHAGWRSLATGIIEKTVRKYKQPTQDIMVWLGPAIGPTQFEVGNDVFQAFCQHSEQAQSAFQQTDPDHYLADIYLLATLQLNKLGVDTIYGGAYCTVSDSNRFFSYRRDGITGRMASMIWITAK